MILPLTKQVSVILVLGTDFCQLKFHNWGSHWSLESIILVNILKCDFGASNISYLGYSRTPDKILPGSDKLKAVKDSEAQSTIQEIRQFMGLCNFFCTHVRSFATVSATLNRQISKVAKCKGGGLPQNCL